MTSRLGFFRSVMLLCLCIGVLLESSCDLRSRETKQIEASFLATFPLGHKGVGENYFDRQSGLAMSVEGIKETLIKYPMIKTYPKLTNTGYPIFSHPQNENKNTAVKAYYWLPADSKKGVFFSWQSSAQNDMKLLEQVKEFARRMAEDGIK